MWLVLGLCRRRKRQQKVRADIPASLGACAVKKVLDLCFLLRLIWGRLGVKQEERCYEKGNLGGGGDDIVEWD